MKFFICNAFSLSMLDREIQSRPAVDPVYETARTPRPVSDELLSTYCRMMLSGEIAWESAVGHADTAAVFANELGLPILANRVSVRLVKGECALIGQYIGPRLPEGCKTLPEGARIEWWIV
jgi:hypothetical protein